MEIQFDNEPKKGSKNATKMYAPTHGRKKVTFQPADERQTRSARAEEADVAFEPGRSAKNELKPLTRFALIVCSFLFAGMILFVLAGYERISRAYQEINTINSSIDETELNINALDVAIECAVTIEQAQTWAKAHNMQYPLQSQYVASGSSIPISGPPAAETDAGTAETPDPDAAATPDPGTEPSPSPDGTPTEAPDNGA